MDEAMSSAARLDFATASAWRDAKSEAARPWGRLYRYVEDCDHVTNVTSVVCSTSDHGRIGRQTEMFVAKGRGLGTSRFEGEEFDAIAE